jgi:hypothetical protein
MDVIEFLGQGAETAFPAASLPLSPCLSVVHECASGNAFGGKNPALAERHGRGREQMPVATGLASTKKSLDVEDDVLQLRGSSAPDLGRRGVAPPGAL